MLQVYASHHGGADSAGSKQQIEVNLTDIATGAVRKSAVVDGVGHEGSAVIRPVLSWPLSTIDQASELVTTRLLTAASGSAESSSDAEAGSETTVHPLLPPTQIAWVGVPSPAVTVAVPSATAAAAVVRVANAAAAPLFYALLTSSFGALLSLLRRML